MSRYLLRSNGLMRFDYAHDSAVGGARPYRRLFWLMIKRKQKMRKKKQA